MLSDHGVYGSKTTRKNRCVRVTYANDCHVDIVPYVVQADGTEVIVNRTTDEFEETNPIGFTSWIQEKDVVTGGDLRKVIRLMKYLRDHRGAFAIKSILLTTVVGERVEQWRKDNDASYYADVPTTLLHVVKDLDEWLQARPTKTQASIGDPSCPNTTFDHRWTDKQYEAFRDDIHDLVAEIESRLLHGRRVGEPRRLAGDLRPPVQGTHGYDGVGSDAGGQEHLHERVHRPGPAGSGRAVHRRPLPAGPAPLGSCRRGGERTRVVQPPAASRRTASSREPCAARAQGDVQDRRHRRAEAVRGALEGPQSRIRGEAAELRTRQHLRGR